MKTTVMTVLAALVALASTGQAAILMGNMSQGITGNSGWTAPARIAVGFTMGATSDTLDSIRLGVDTSPSVSLWSSTGSSGSATPLASLFTFSSVTGSAGDWTVAGSYALTAGVSYFVVLAGSGTWDVRGATYPTGTGATFMNNAYDFGGGTFVSGIVSPALAMDIVTAVPEPREYAVLAGLCLLGFAAIRRKLAA